MMGEKNLSESYEELVANAEEVYTDGSLKSCPKFEEEMDIKENLGQLNNTEREEFKEFEMRYNRRALSTSATTYELENFEKKAMIIFNHEIVEGFRKRVGTEKDVEALKNTFSKFGFEINCHNNLKKKNVLEELKKFSEKDFTDYGCIIIVVLTHGLGNGLIRATDEEQFYSELDILNYFKARNKLTLFSKPIILLIQACRGYSSQKGVTNMLQMLTHRDLAADEFQEPYHLPLECDMLAMHSCFAGKPAYLTTEGSWFIQTLCKEINRLYATHDFESILLEVKRKVAIEKYYAEHNRSTGEHDINKQMPVITSALIRKLYLRGYKDSGIPPPTIPLPLKVESVDTSLDAQERANVCPNSCRLKHFYYMRKCLRNYIEEYPKDQYARSLLKMADFKNKIDRDNVSASLYVISNYLETKQHYEFRKHIYFYKDQPIDLENENCGLFTKFLDNFHIHFIPFTAGFCLSAYITYKYFKRD